MLSLRIHFLASELLATTCIPGLVPSSSFKVHHSHLTSIITTPFPLLCQISLCLFYRKPCDYIGPTQLIQDNLPIYMPD